MADNLSALTQQISKFSSTASVQTNSFRQAAGDQNRSIAKMIRDLANHFVAQRGSLENVSSAVEDSVEQTSDLSRKIDSNSNLTRQSISILDSIATQIRNSNSILGRIDAHGQTNNSFLKSLLGAGIGAAAGYLAADQMKDQVSGGDNSLFGNSDQKTGKSSNGATPSSPSGGTTKPTSSGDSSPSTSLDRSTPITVGQGATPAGASYKEKIKNSSNNFNAVAPGLMTNLMKDFNLTQEQASGILGNLGHESAGLHADINEGKPLIARSRGGYGLAQWTGPRRKDLEKFAKENELPVNSVDTQYQFLKKELTGNKQYARILNNVRQEKTPEGAARAFLPFETGGDPRAIVAMGSRNKFAKMANSINLSQQPTTVASSQQPTTATSSQQPTAVQSATPVQRPPLVAQQPTTSTNTEEKKLDQRANLTTSEQTTNQVASLNPPNNTRSATPITSAPITPGFGGETDPITGLQVASVQTPNLNTNQNLQDKQILTSEIKQAALTSDSAPTQPIVNVSQPTQQVAQNRQTPQRDPLDSRDSSTSPSWIDQINRYIGEGGSLRMV